MTLIVSNVRWYSILGILHLESRVCECEDSIQQSVYTFDPPPCPLAPHVLPPYFVASSTLVISVRYERHFFSVALRALHIHAVMTLIASNVRL